MGDREGGAIGQQLEVRRHARLLHFATTDDNYRAYGPPQTAVMQAYKPTAVYATVIINAKRSGKLIDACM